MTDITPAPATPASAPKSARWLAVVLLVVTAAMQIARHVGGDVADFMSTYVALDVFTPDVQEHLGAVLMVPLGSLIVVFARLTLGIRMLGPFRPILIAIALHATGVLVGGLFLVIVLYAVAQLRPRLKNRGLPYFGRLSVLLATVVLIEVVVLLVGGAYGLEELQRAAYFPIVVLCLAADGFARVLEEQGLRIASWRATTTFGLALIINALYQLAPVQDALLAWPELILALIAAILLVSSDLNLQLLQGLNPKA
jgi:hypothetical protein